MWRERGGEREREGEGEGEGEGEREREKGRGREGEEISCLVNHCYNCDFNLQKFKNQSMEDGIIEVVGFWSSTFVSMHRTTLYHAMIM